jgi:hypothetical protein
MDIRKPQSITTVDTTTRESELKRTFAAGTVLTAKASDMLPELVQFKLKALMTQYGIPFDLNDIKLDGKMAENVKVMRKIKEMVEGDSKLLPEMLKLIKGLMRAEIKLAQFHRGVTTAALKHQEKLDKYTADIFLKMAGYQSKSAKLEHRTNVRNKLIEKRTQAYSNHYENTVYGEEAKIIDAEFEVLESNKKILSASKTERAEFNAERKKKINEYVESAFTD